MARIPAITPLIQSEWAQSQRQKDQDLYRAVQSLEQALNAVNRELASVVSSAVSTVVAGGIAVKKFTLTADLAPPPPTEDVDQVFLYVVTQDGTGGWVINWPDPPFKAMPQPDPTANLVSLIFAYKKAANLILPATFQVGGLDTS